MGRAGRIGTPKGAAGGGAGSDTTAVHTGDSAGGDLAGTYPNPTIGASKIITTSILDAAVTLAKHANIATARFLGRLTAGSGVPEELTAAQVASAITSSLPYAGAVTADVTTSETTASTTFTDLATSGPAVTATIGASGLALVIVSANLSISTSGTVHASFQIGAGTALDVDSASVAGLITGTTMARATRATVVTGLTPGSNTFTMKYRVSTNTGTFINRRILVIPL